MTTLIGLLSHEKRVTVADQLERSLTSQNCSTPMPEADHRRYSAVEQATAELESASWARSASGRLSANAARLPRT